MHRHSQVWENAHGAARSGAVLAGNRAPVSVKVRVDSRRHASFHLTV